MMGLLNPKFVGNRPLFLHDSCCVPKPWEFSSGTQYNFFFSQINHFLEEVLNSQTEKPHKKSGAPLS